MVVNSRFTIYGVTLRLSFPASRSPRAPMRGVTWLAAVAVRTHTRALGETNGRTARVGSDPPGARDAVGSDVCDPPAAVDRVPGAPPRQEEPAVPEFGAALWVEHAAEDVPREGVGRAEEARPDRRRVLEGHEDAAPEPLGVVG